MLVASCVIYSRKRPTQGLLSMLFHLDPLVELCPLFMFLYALTASSRQRRHRLHILAKAFSVFKAWLTNPRTSRSGTSFHVWKDVCIYPCSTIYHYFLLKWPKEVRATRRSGYNLHVLQVAEKKAFILVYYYYYYYYFMAQVVVVFYNFLRCIEIIQWGLQITYMWINGGS